MTEFIWWCDSLIGTTAWVVVDVEGTVLIVSAAGALEGGPLVGAAKVVCDAFLALCNSDSGLDGEEGLWAGIHC